MQDVESQCGCEPELLNFAVLFKPFSEVRYLATLFYLPL